MAAVHIGTLLLANKASSLARSCFSSFLLASRRFVSTRPSDHPPAADFLLGLNLLSNLLNLGIGERAEPAAETKSKAGVLPDGCRRSSCVRRRGRNRGIALNNSATRSHFLPFGQVPCLLQVQSRRRLVVQFTRRHPCTFIIHHQSIGQHLPQPNADQRPSRPLHTPSLCKEIPSRCSTP